MVSITALKDVAVGFVVVGTALGAAMQPSTTAALSDTTNLGCCEGAEAPFEGAVCYPFAPADKCETVWINEAIMHQVPAEAAATSAASDGPDGASVLHRRLHYVRTDDPKRVCESNKNSAKCVRRNRNALTDDCTTLSSFWDVQDRTDYWVIAFRDLAGQNWLRLVQHNSCTFAVGNTQSGGGDTSLGNIDIAEAIDEGVRACGPLSSEIEAEGHLECKSFPLGFSVTSTNKFKCCM